MPYQFSDELDDQLLYERIDRFVGMDSFTRSTQLPEGVHQYFENCYVPDNLELRTRPGATALGNLPIGSSALLQEDSGYLNQEDLGRILLEDSSSSDPGLIQALCYFDTQALEQLLCFSLGRFFVWEGSTWVENSGFVSSSATARIAMVQGVNKVLISDGVANMRSWDGAAFADLGNLKNTIQASPPVGATILAWHTGRAFAAGVASEDDTLYASYLLDFTKWDHTQFKLRIGGGEGDPIHALIPMQDFILGVLKENSVYLVNADPTAVSAADWTIKRVAQGLGVVGRDAWAMWGNDVLFMARDGVRSLKRMQAAAGQYDVSPPLSQPMQVYIDRINWTYQHLIAARAYKELVLFSVPLDSATSNNAVLVFNARLGSWIGVWTGWTPSCWEVTRFNGVQHLVFGQADGIIRQWNDAEDRNDDDTYKDDDSDIMSRAYMRATQFGELVNDKNSYHAQLQFSASNALVAVTLFGDSIELKSYNADVRQKGLDLPFDLPADLSTPGNVTNRRGLRRLTPFNEAYLVLQSTSGWWALRSVTMTAYLNMLRNQT